MSNIATVKLAIKKWMHEQLGFTVIFTEQADPRPTVRPYATLRFMNETMIGGDDEVREVDASGTMTLKHHRRAIIDLNIYGADAVNLMSGLRDTLKKDTVIQRFWNTYGISFLSTETLQNLTELLETEWEERAQMDINIAYARESTDDVGLIEHVEIEGEVNGKDLPTQTIDLP